MWDRGEEVNELKEGNSEVKTVWPGNERIRDLWKDKNERKRDGSVPESRICEEKGRNGFKFEDQIVSF